MTSTPQSVWREDLVLVRYEAKDAEDVLRALVNLLHEIGAVKDSYFDSMMAREREYPTGLPTEEVKVALPHAGVEHVHFSALAVATLAHPVTFREMGAPDNELDVEIVMMLANADPDEQVDTLRRLVDMFDEPASLHALMAATTPEAVVRLMRDGWEND